MKLSLNWLESYFVDKPDWSEVLAKLTMAGIEVEGIESVAPEFNGIVVAEVVSCSKHPDADKLSICKVNAGTGELLQIVCGAPNVTAGVKVPCALVGAVLPDGLIISDRKMRGVMSFGMLCSGNEIACPDGIDGLLLLPTDAPVGASIREYLGLDDKVIELKITPNRGDCLSVQGLLREISALTDYKVQHLITPAELAPTINQQIQVVMDAAEVCHNYLALVIKGINNQVKLPEYITKRLSRSGLRTISPIVDITNYVMLELGQPLHAFDLGQVGNQLRVRFAQDKETLKLLDGKVVTLTTDTLVICDSSNHPAAIAGVMGGYNSGVNETTTDLILESAWFTPEVIAGKAKQYGVSSDSAYRFERGVDTQLQAKALNYAAQLMTKFCGGKIGVVQATNFTLKTQPLINLKYAAINRLIGTSIAPQNITNILLKLGFQIAESKADDLAVMAPSFRFDINIPEDVIEEIARVYGYANIVPIMPVASFKVQAIDSNKLGITSLKAKLVSLGYHEIVSYAFVEERLEDLLGNPQISPVSLQNPIAGLAVMRTSLIADLVKALMHNLNRGHKFARLFEVARVFYAEDAQSQPLKIAGLSYGTNYPLTWAAKPHSTDFFDLKHDVELLLHGIPEITFVPCTDYPVLHGGRTAKIWRENQLIGIIGQLHP
ncbi:MAG: phenylalanine--tRNA ligase subunit beta, partial [Burkholderiales bacterium]